MRIQFYDDPIPEPRVPEEVRFNQLGIYMYEDGQRFMVGLDLTPFTDRPSVQVFVTDESDIEVASLTIIESLQTNFNMTMHLAAENNCNLYDVSAILYYRNNDGDKLVVDQITKKLDASLPGEQ